MLPRPRRDAPASRRGGLAACVAALALLPLAAAPGAAQVDGCGPGARIGEPCGQFRRPAVAAVTPARAPRCDSARGVSAGAELGTRTTECVAGEPSARAFAVAEAAARGSGKLMVGFKEAGQSRGVVDGRVVVGDSTVARMRRALEARGFVVDVEYPGLPFLAGHVPEAPADGDAAARRRLAAWVDGLLADPNVDYVEADARGRRVGRPPRR